MPTRFLLHVLPKGFHRIRHYGLLASAGCKANIVRGRQLMAAPMAEVDPPALHDTADPDATTDHRPPARVAATACSLSRSLRAAVHHAARPPATGSTPDPMIFFSIPWRHPFFISIAGTSRSRRRTSFIPASTSAGRAPRTISQSARRIWPQPPVRNHRRLSALSNLKETISRQRRCRDKSP
jgi:Putative transposase